MDVRRTAARDARAATRFLTKAIRRHGVPEQRTIDGSAAHEAAITSDNAAHDTAIVIRKSTSHKSVGAQDHRGVTRITCPLRGFTSFEAAPCHTVVKNRDDVFTEYGKR